MPNEHLPDSVKVFYVNEREARDMVDDGYGNYQETGKPGWYWWTYSPSCDDQGGPFATKTEAVADAQKRGK